MKEFMFYFVMPMAVIFFIQYSPSKTDKENDHTPNGDAYNNMSDEQLNEALDKVILKNGWNKMNKKI